MLPASNLRKVELELIFSDFGAINDVPVFEVEEVNVAPGEHSVLLPAFPLLDRTDGEAQLGRPDKG